MPEEKAPSLLQLVEQQEMSACVQGCLDSLTDPYRAVILLHDVRGMSGPEIASALGVSLPNVKIRLLGGAAILFGLAIVFLATFIPKRIARFTEARG